MRLTMLGTGNAMVTECYNTCFVLTNERKEHLLVDGGGGNQILSQLKKAQIDLNEIHHIFVTHKHIDHLLGIVWVVRVICQRMKQGKYSGDAYIYSHHEVIELIEDMAGKLLQESQTAFIGKRLHLVEITDGEKKEIIGKEVTFFDIHSTKATQFGFRMKIGDTEALTCCGDEPYQECEEPYVRDCTWLLHEAFCRYEEADEFKPYEKHHSTVKDACELAATMNVKNLILYHTEDKNILNRRELYTREGAPYYQGKLMIPEDLDVISLL